ncbi:MAG TPA: hypothetical protein VK856_16365 [Anaerolineaceae bacterium]|nr:hypothetical protein [Anaerolineaceae bacterium]
MNFSDQQSTIAHDSLSNHVFLTGFSGCGKTTTGKAFLDLLVKENTPGNKILILVPQKSLGLTYQDFLETMTFYNGTLPVVQTITAISQKIIKLFWPVIAPKFEFSEPKNQPVFLNIESSQYFMAKVCQPFFDNNYFSTIKSEKPRILSQILDNLNKAAVIGFPHDEIGNKLKDAWNMDVKHLVAYDEAQECAISFRKYCLQNNLLDFSLQMEVFHKSIQQSFLIKEYLFKSFEYCLFDNCEEDTPLAHDLMIEWYPNLRGSLTIYDEHAGYRSFLGADPKSALRLKQYANHTYELAIPYNSSPQIQNLIILFEKAIHRQHLPEFKEDTFDAVSFGHHKFFPDMVDAVVNQVLSLIEEGIEPGNIAILSPFVSNSMRFQIQHRLEDKGLKLISHRPSRSLQEEPITHGLITWVKIAYPEWDLSTSIFQFRTAIHQALGNMDPIRADILSRIVLSKNQSFPLRPMDDLKPEMLDRISLQAALQYKKIYSWLVSYQNQKSEMDVFLASFFGEILSQPEFGFHNNFGAAEITGKLIESMQNFRKNTINHFQSTNENWAIDYLNMLENGLISALYIQNWEEPPLDSVYLAPAHTFLMQNRSIDIQIWLDIGSMGWWQRLMQPLTQPYVLSRNWTAGSKWTDIHEFENNQLNMEKMISGLLRRCNRKIFLHTAGYNENGDEQAGPLLKATQRILRMVHHQFGSKDV